MAQEGSSPHEPDEHRGEGGELPQRPPPPPPRLSRDEPLNGPVTLAEVDCEVAKKGLENPFVLASSVYPEVDAKRIALLVAAVIDLIVSRAEAGRDDAISISEVGALAGIGSGVEDLLGPPLSEFGQLVVRAIFAQAANRVFYEQMESHSAVTGRRHNGEGSEKVPGIARNQLHLLHHSLAGSAKHLSLGSRPLNYGTRWARSCERFGAGLPDWALERMDSFLDSVGDHVGAALAEDRQVQKRILEGLRGGHIALPRPITDKRLLAARSHYLVIGPVPYGTSLEPHRSHHGTCNPGRDGDVVEQATASRRTAALACGQLSEEERLAFEEDAETLTVGRLPSMYELGIGRIPGVEYRWSPSRHELARYSAGEGARIDSWRLIGVEEDRDFWRAVTMVERHAQVSWTSECTDRYEAECLPGKVQAHLPEQCAGLRALSDMANNAIVDAIRRPEGH